MTEYWMENRTDRLPQVRILGNAFLQDDRSNKVGVRLIGSDIPDGTVKGYIIRPDEQMCYATGQKSVNEAWILLPDEAYDKIGKIYVTIRIENGDDKMTLGAFEGNVYRSITSTIV